MLKHLVEEICRAKREAHIVPVLATELELKQELSRRGVKWTAETFKQMLAELEADADIIVRRCLRYNGYTTRDYANDTETDA